MREREVVLACVRLCECLVWFPDPSTHKIRACAYYRDNNIPHLCSHNSHMQDIGSHRNIVTSISSTLFSQCQHLRKHVDIKDMDYAYVGHHHVRIDTRTLGDIAVMT